MYTDMKMWRDIRRRVIVEGDGKRQICRECEIQFKCENDELNTGKLVTRNS